MCDCDSDFCITSHKKKFQYLLNVLKNTLETDLGIFPIDLKSKRCETGSDPVHICIARSVWWTVLDAWHALNNNLSLDVLLFLLQQKFVLFYFSDYIALDLNILCCWIHYIIFLIRGQIIVIMPYF